MKWIKRILVVVLALVVLVVGVGFLLPSKYEVERSVVLKTEKSRVHALVGDLKQWESWSPWTEADPTIKVTLGERTTGVGAHQSWTGDRGACELTFTSSDPEKGVLFDLSFDEGATRSTGGFAYATAPEGVQVTWSMKGDWGANPIRRYFGLIVDPMMGPYFERGLEKLKARAESK